MKGAFIEALESRVEFVKCLWRFALVRAPVRSPLGNPDILAFMMDDTLSRLFSIVRLQTRSDSPVQRPVESPLVSPFCRCALNPFIGYHLAAESALVSAVRQLPAITSLGENDVLTSERELLEALHVLGRSDIHGFCELCRIEAPSLVAAGVGSTLPEFCPHKKHPPVPEA